MFHALRTRTLTRSIFTISFDTGIVSNSDYAHLVILAVLGIYFRLKYLFTSACLFPIRSIRVDCWITAYFSNKQHCVYQSWRESLICRLKFSIVLFNFTNVWNIQLLLPFNYATMILPMSTSVVVSWNFLLIWIVITRVAKYIFITVCARVSILHGESVICNNWLRHRNPYLGYL